MPRSQPMPPDKRQARNAGRRNEAARRGAAEWRGRRIDVGPGGTAFDEGAIKTRHYAHGIHQRHVDHQSAIADGIACNIVPARAYRDGEFMLAVLSATVDKKSRPYDRLSNGRVGSGETLLKNPSVRPNHN